MPLSDPTLIHRFTGSNRRYLLVWDNGESARFRARDLKDARRVARQFTERLTANLLVVRVERVEVSDD